MTIKQAVGWVKRSVTHRFSPHTYRRLMGYAALPPILQMSFTGIVQFHSVTSPINRV